MLSDQLYATTHPPKPGEPVYIVREARFLFSSLPLHMHLFCPRLNSNKIEKKKKKNWP